MGKMLSISDISKKYGVPYVTVYNWVKTGTIKATQKDNGFWEIPLKGFKCPKIQRRGRPSTKKEVVKKEVTKKKVSPKKTKKKASPKKAKKKVAKKKTAKKK